MMPRRPRPRMQQASLFERWEQPLLRWDMFPEEVRQEAMRLLMELFHLPARADSADRVGEGVSDE